MDKPTLPSAVPRHVTKTVLDRAGKSAGGAPPKDHVEIVKLPAEHGETKAQKLAGRVVDRDLQHHTVRVRTNRGDIDVKLPADRPVPQRGAAVEIKLPANPVRGNTAQLTALPAPPPQIDQVHLNSPAPVKPAVTYPTITPNNLSHNSAAPPHDAVRLTPLPPALMPQIQGGGVSALPSVQTSLLPFLQNLGVGIVSVPLQSLNASLTTAATSIVSPGFASLEVLPMTGTPRVLSMPVFGQSVLPATAMPEGAVPLTEASFLTGGARQHHVVPQFSASSALLQPVHSTIDLPQIMSQHLQNIHMMSASPAQMTGMVIGHLPQGESVFSLQSFNLTQPPQLFIMQNITAEVGSVITLPTSSLSAAPLAEPRPLVQNIDILLKPGNWPALDEMMEVLQQISPQMAGIAARSMPNIQNPAQIPAGLLLFFMAAKGGDLSGWLGDKPMDTLRRAGRGDVLNRVSGDMATLSRAAADPLPGDWRTLPFPFMGQGELNKIVLFYKKEEEGAESVKGGKRHTRFIFDMDLSRMGMVQIDGLFNPAAAVPRLDIVLRTEAPLSEPMKNSLRQNYTRVLNASGAVGDLSYQSDTENFVRILSETDTLYMVT